MTAAAAPHWPISVQGVAGGKPEECAIFQSRIHPAFADDGLPVAGGADLHRPAEVAGQRVPTENAAIPSAGPDAAIGHGGRSETPFAGDGRGIMPGPEHLARASVTGFET